MMLSTCKLYLYDAVYLYLRTINQTLTDSNSDYKDGRVIRNKTIGQWFTGKHQKHVESFTRLLTLILFSKIAYYLLLVILPRT